MSKLVIYAVQNVKRADVDGIEKCGGAVFPSGSGPGSQRWDSGKFGELSLL